jgi:hypothetical protein
VGWDGVTKVQAPRSSRGRACGVDRCLWRGILSHTTNGPINPLKKAPHHEVKPSRQVAAGRRRDRDHARRLRGRRWRQRRATCAAAAAQRARARRPWRFRARVNWWLRAAAAAGAAHRQGRSAGFVISSGPPTVAAQPVASARRPRLPVPAPWCRKPASTRPTCCSATAPICTPAARHRAQDATACLPAHHGRAAGPEAPDLVDPVASGANVAGMHSQRRWQGLATVGSAWESAAGRPDLQDRLRHSSACPRCPGSGRAARCRCTAWMSATRPMPAPART